MKRINILRKIVFFGLVGVCVALVLGTPALAQQQAAPPSPLPPAAQVIPVPAPARE